MTASSHAGTGRMTTPVRTVRRELSPAECYPLLAAARIGRLVLGPADEPTSLTVSYAVARPMVMLRTGTDTELAARLDCLVHLEVDPPGAGWSVLLTGHAARVTGTLAGGADHAAAVAGRRPRGLPADQPVPDHWSAGFRLTRARLRGGRPRSRSGSRRSGARPAGCAGRSRTGWSGMGRVCGSPPVTLTGWP